MEKWFSLHRWKRVGNYLSLNTTLLLFDTIGAQIS